ncbi:MAG: Poxvirus G6 [Thiotrichales bacterium SG8_50]|nr:MAG: Poxvirus G6 [Thiotrichales bacterium SG8_50]
MFWPDDDEVAVAQWRQRNAECVAHLASTHAGDKGGAVLAAEMDAYLDQAEQALTYRAETIAVAQRLKRRLAEDAPLAGQDLDILNAGMAAHLELRQALLDVAYRHECLLDAPRYLLAEWGFTPATRLRAVMVSLSSALVLYDNYLLAIAVYEQDDKLRRLLNDPDSGYELGAHELNQVTLSYNSIKNRARVRRAIRYYEDRIRTMPAEFLGEPHTRYLHLLITQSPSYRNIVPVSPVYVASRKLEFLTAMTEDTLAELQAEGLNLFSMYLGNTMGLVETRQGKLFGRPDIERSVESALRAGDILVEKTPFRLTDSFIPGHWGHAAIWVGSESELRELGIWDHPVVVPHQRDIRAGRRIVEALRSGVQLSGLAQFLNIDDLGVLRQHNASAQQRAEVIVLALRQVGKAYDFNFDVETTDRIVCSELVYVTYTHLNWPTEKTLGRATISPDNVASKALDDGPLGVVLLFHDGQLVDEDPLRLMSLLMNSN